MNNNISFTLKNIVSRFHDGMGKFYNGKLLIDQIAVKMYDNNGKFGPYINDRAIWPHHASSMPTLLCLPHEKGIHSLVKKMCDENNIEGLKDFFVSYFSLVKYNYMTSLFIGNSISYNDTVKSVDYFRAQSGKIYHKSLASKYFYEESFEEDKSVGQSIINFYEKQKIKIDINKTAMCYYCGIYSLGKEPIDHKKQCRYYTT